MAEEVAGFVAGDSGLRWSLEVFMLMMSVPRIVRVRFDTIAYVISYVSQLRAYVQISCGAGGVRSGGKLCPKPGNRLT